MAEFPYRTVALPVEQPFGKFFTVVLPADLLLSVAFTAPARVVESGPFGYRLAGTQRKQRVERAAEVGKFIDTVEAVFPTSIVLATNYHEDGSLDEGESRWVIESADRQGDPPTLIIPTRKKLASVVDGQHRLWGFKFSNIAERATMPLVCSVFFDLPNPYQAYLFATVNFNQQKVDRSLAYELWGFDTEDEPPHAWTPEKAAVFLTRRLNTDTRSPLRGRIRVTAQDDERLTPAPGAGDWGVSTATVVDGLLKLFSRKPMEDRSAMFMQSRRNRDRGELPNDNTPARKLFLTTNDSAIYELARSFLSAADDLFWQNVSPNSYIIRTVGVQALFDVMSKTATEAINNKTLKASFFVDVMQGPAREIDFTDNFFQASGIGKTRIANCLYLGMGRKALADVPERDREHYHRLVPSAFT